MLIDNVSIKVKAGHGGKGAVAFSKIMMTLGPTGGSGGKGGSVYLETVADIAALRRYRAKKDFRAEDGRDGRLSFRDGHAGADLVLPVPRGTVARGLADGTEHELTAVGERLLVARGGSGGRGNFHFRSPTNRSPKQSEPGTPGEEASLSLELKLIADIGFVGLPNAGKSSLLNALTNAQSRVANYAFTTLEPHLGAYYGIILADIPGIIEGASSGKGLGVKFLRHIERTRTLFHCIDVNSDDPVRDYDVIRGELGAYNAALLAKPEYVLVTKTDTADDARAESAAKALAVRVPIARIIPVSVETKEGTALLRRALDGIVRELLPNS